VIVGGVITNQPLTDGTTPAARKSHRFASIDAEVSRPASSSMRLRRRRSERRERR
jgi:hypothetical protein